MFLSLCLCLTVFVANVLSMTVCCCLSVLSLILDNERWKQADVPAEFQTLVNSLIDGM